MKQVRSMTPTEILTLASLPFGLNQSHHSPKTRFPDVAVKTEPDFWKVFHKLPSHMSSIWSLDGTVWVIEASKAVLRRIILDTNIWLFLAVLPPKASFVTFFGL